MSESKHTLLVVDDEKPIIESLRGLFRRRYRVLTASSATEGLEILRESPADIILSDQRMPDMTGDKFLEKARELAPDSVRLLITGYADVQAVIRAVNRGRIFGYIAKPWNVPDLESLVRQAVAHHELLRTNRELTQELQEANQALEEKVQERTRELEELEHYQESLIRSVGQGILVVDREGSVASLNPAASAFLHLPAQDVVGNSYESCPSLAPFSGSIRQCLATGEQGEYKETEILDSSSPALLQATYLGFQTNPIFTRTGERRGVIVSFQNITERRQMERQLNQSDKLSTLGQLAGGVAHEINNPLGVILGFTQILLRHQELGDQHHRRLQNIERQCLRCRDIVAKLLKFARRSKVKLQAVQINSVITETFDLLGRQLEVDDIEFEIKLDRAAPEVTADGTELEQIVFNLVTNARDAISELKTSRGGKIYAESRSGAEFVEVRISDTGPGVPEELKEKIFDPFFTTKEPGSGTGLGLPVSRGIARRHGGDLILENSPGGGSTFILSVPIPDQPPEPEIEPEVIPVTPTAGLRILVVDDEDDIRQLCDDYLSGDHSVVTVQSGPLALEKLKESPFNLVLLDIMMPGMDGVTTLEHIRKMGFDLPVVIMTGKANERLQSARKRLSILEVLEKPFSIAELDRVMSAAVAATSHKLEQADEK